MTKKIYNTVKIKKGENMENDFNYKDAINNEQIEGNLTDAKLRKDYQCGVFNYRPQWLQSFADKSVYTFAIAIFGLVIYGEMASFQGSMSSLEKNFSLSAKTVTSFKVICQSCSILASLTMTYLADRGNKLRWIASSAILFCIACGVSILPIFTPISLQNINAYMTNDNISLLVNQEKNEYNLRDNYETYHLYVLIPFVVGQIMMGIAMAIQRTCGLAYIDDNIRKNEFPIFYSITYAMQWFGYAFGLLILSAASKIYVFPNYNPKITNTDSRWIGAWWLGSLLFGFIILLIAPIFLLFPKRLRTQNNESLKKPKPEVSWHDFKTSLKCVLTNKILMTETLSSIAFGWGILATFWPKYLEVQFDMTLSQANFIQGIVEFISKPLGMFIMSVCIMKFKPRPRVLLGWNMMFSCVSFLAGFMLIFTTCKKQHVRGHINNYNKWDLNEECNIGYNCSYDIKYSPVCDTISNDIFFSDCHAGCQFVFKTNNKTIYDNCKCPKFPNSLKEGTCYNDCSTTAIIFTILIMTIKSLKAATRSIKSIVEFRSMRETEKSFSLGIVRSIQTLAIAVPGIVVYGWLIDNSCLVWDYKFGTKGNCWLYDTDKMRYMFFITCTVALGFSIILDFFVFLMVKRLKFYDEDSEGNSISKNEKNHEIQQVLMEDITE